jgi:hypothetical protein
MHCVLWFLLDYILLSAVNRTALPFSRLDYLICWIYKEAMTFPLFVRALFNPVVSWRGSSYIIRWGGVVEEIKSSASQPPSPALVSPSSSTSSSLGSHRITIPPIVMASSAANLAKSVSTSAVSEPKESNVSSESANENPVDGSHPSILLSSASAPPSPSSNGLVQLLQAQHQFLTKSNSSNNDNNNKSALSGVYTL